MLRTSVAIVVAFALSACASNRDVGIAPPPASSATAATPTAPPPPRGAWLLDRRIDRATGKPVGKAGVSTERVTVRSRKPFATATSVLMLQCFKDAPVVQFLFPYRVGSNRTAKLTYRFDDKPPRDAAVRFLPDYKTVVIEDRPAVQQFVAELRAAKTLFVSINSLVVGPTRAEYPVESPGPAIEVGFADCPGPTPARRSARFPYSFLL
jgi:hypothetical protein